jgi:type I restriction enzyme R subunit
MSSLFTETPLVEQPYIDKILALGDYRYLSTDELNSYRTTTEQVVLVDILRSQIIKLNPWCPRASLIDEAIEKLTGNRSYKSLYQANKEVYAFIKYGVKIDYINDHSESDSFTFQLIDRTNQSNDWIVTNQITYKWPLYEKRPDIMIYLNGLPLIVIECKNMTQPIRQAFDDNISDYLSALPGLRPYNLAVIITNGTQNKIGSLTSNYEHYFTWKKTEEGGEHSIGMDMMISGFLHPMTVLDYLQHFVLFDDADQVKIIAKNHQYIWVNRTYERFLKRWEISWKLWVFRHTQWSGKSYSMMMFCQKISRSLKWNFSFVLVTDRTELDTQISNWFAACGLTDDKWSRATSIAWLSSALKQDKKYIFTLIHKFESGMKAINTRDDIIVITDEAHRSQYGELAMYMRDALPNACYLGFTGTPLISDEIEKTKDLFGDYVSVYNFSESIEDGATVPIYYENRTPKVISENPDLAEQLQKIQSDLSEEEEEKLNREFTTAYAILSREDVLDIVADDIARHFLGRWPGSDGKAMVVWYTKYMTVKLYWKVLHKFEQIKKDLIEKMQSSPTDKIRFHTQKKERARQLAILDTMDMGVMMSLWDRQEDERKFWDAWGDFSMLRKRIEEMDGDMPALEKKFKDNKSNLKLMFVCSMWLTGFDVKSCTTLYLYKSLNGHNLMQTIARTNRVYGDKTNGLIVDYVNVFANLKQALAIYASTPELTDIEQTLQDKSHLMDNLMEWLGMIQQFSDTHKLNLFDLKTANDPSQQLSRIAEIVVADMESCKQFIKLCNTTLGYYYALLPQSIDQHIVEKIKIVKLIVPVLQHAQGETIDIASVKEQLEDILDQSITIEQFSISQNYKITDLSKINYNALKEKFDQEQHSVINGVVKWLEEKLTTMVSINPKRFYLIEKLQKLMTEYNLWSKTTQEIFEELMQYCKELDEEEQRSVREWLDEESLALFDIIIQAKGDHLDDKDEKKVKQVAKELLDSIKSIVESSVNWIENTTIKSLVQTNIYSFLYEQLPASYTEQDIGVVRNLVFDYTLEHYWMWRREMVVS